MKESVRDDVMPSVCEHPKEALVREEEEEEDEVREVREVPHRVALGGGPGAGCTGARYTLEGVERRGSRGVLELRGVFFCGRRRG